MEVKYSTASTIDAKGKIIPQDQLNFKSAYTPKTVVSDELMSSGKLNIWANEDYIKDNKGYGISDNGVIFEFWTPEKLGDPFNFYPTLGIPQK